MLNADEIKAFFGCKFKEHRLKIGLTQDELAQVLGMTRASVINMETGRHTPTLTGLYHISCVLQCLPGELIPEPEYTPLQSEEVEIQVVKKYKRLVFKQIKKP